MEELANDPIISFYMKMSKSTESENELPLYSETMLRLSFKEVFGTMRPIYSNELELYRHLILFSFSERYASLTDLTTIMTCFDECTIRSIFERQNEILAQWRIFLKKNLYSVVYKEALNEVLYEYTIRYLSIYGEVDDSFLKRKAEDVQNFLRCNSTLPKQWFRSFKALLKNRIGQTQYEHTEDLTEHDLNLVNIFLAIKSRLNILVVEDLSKRLTQFMGDKSPPTKRSKLQRIDDDGDDGDDDSSSNNADNTNNIESYVQNSEANANEAVTDTEHCINSEKQIVDEDVDADDDNDVYEQGEEDKQKEDEEEEDGSYLSSIDQSEIKVETQETVEIQRLDMNGSDCESETITANEKNDDHSESDETFSNDKSITNINKNQSIIDCDTALSYLAALQAYAVVNSHFGAIGLLDEVDSIFRTTKKQ